MSAIGNLKLSSTKRPTAMPAVQLRRNKLAKKVWEQIQLAKAQQSGTTFSVVRHKTLRNEDGTSRNVELHKRVRQWWFVADSGKLCLNVRYGAKLIEITKGKSTVEVGTTAELVPTLEIIKGAVEAGELDAQLEQVSDAVAAAFKH